MMFAQAFAQRGEQIIVATSTLERMSSDAGLEIHRGVGMFGLGKLIRWADVVFQNNVSLRLGWPLFFIRKPLVTAIHTWIPIRGNDANWQNRLKQSFISRGMVIAVSRTVSDHLEMPSTVIYNSYRTDLFFEAKGICRDLDLLYVGRLVSDKGVDLLLKSLHSLSRDGLRPSLTIAGSGAEEKKLREMAGETGLAEQVRFVGGLSAEELRKLYNRAKICVVPSVWEEPFGIVVLEALACGCAVLVSKTGGLPEAAGPCGLYFRSGDRADLADRIKVLLANSSLRAKLLSNRDEHLRQFQPEKQVEDYLSVLRAACKL